MAIIASPMAAYFRCSFCEIAKPDRSDDSRSLNGFSVTNTMPADGLLMKPLIDRPGNATALSTPGSFSAISDIWRITFSVRSSVAPSGSCAKPTR